MNFLDFPFWQSFVSNLGATLIGAGLGIPIAFWINRKIEDVTAKERRKKIYSVLYEDLKDNQERLYTWMIEERKIQDIMELVTSLRDELWFSLSDSGELEWIRDPNLMRDLSYTYCDIRSIKSLGSLYFQLIEFPTKETSAIATNKVKKNIEELIADVAHNIPLIMNVVGFVKTIEELNLDKKPSLFDSIKFFFQK